MEEYTLDDPTQLLQAASDFGHHPGVHSDASAKAFLHRFPLPVIINVLQTKADVPGVESTLVACLERIFCTKHGASLIPQYMVSCLLENFGENTVPAAQLIVEHDIYPLLLDCLINGNEQVATASMDAIKSLAGSFEGMEIIFPANDNEATHLRNLAARCSSLGRVRVLALVVKLFSVSSSVASLIHNSDLLNLLEAGVCNTDDTLVTLSVLELLYELAEIQHGTEFLPRTTLVQLLSSIIGNTSMESILRSRAMMISGRLLSKENIFKFIDESCVKTVISLIDGRLRSLESQDADECESALEALGQIGSSIHGAELLLLSSPPAARHVIDAAFDRQGRGRQLGLFLSVLQQDAEVRLAGYRVITGLVARPWCLMEICSKQEIVNIITGAHSETTKIGMEAKYNCCKAIHWVFMSSSKLTSDPALTGIAEKLQEAVRRGPYLARKLQEAQPVVMTADRF